MYAFELRPTNGMVIPWDRYDQLVDKEKHLASLMGKIVHLNKENAALYDEVADKSATVRLLSCDLDRACDDLDRKNLVCDALAERSAQIAGELYELAVENRTLDIANSILTNAYLRLREENEELECRVDDLKDELEAAEDE